MGYTYYAWTTYIDGDADAAATALPGPEMSKARVRYVEIFLQVRWLVSEPVE